MKRRSHPWLELLRLPNLFTVPGDVLVGWCLGGFQSFFPWWGILASLCLYSAGLLFNDVFDTATDALERPKRPIPSGRVSRAQVFRVACVLSGLGLVLSGPGFPVAVALLVLILLYDLGLKALPGIGVLTMGLCRGFNLYLGFAVSAPFGQLALPTSLFWAMVFFTGYIVLLSLAALNEAAPRASLRGWMRWSPFLWVLTLLPLFYWLGISWLVMWWALIAALFLLPTLLFRQSVPGFVGALIRHLIPLQLVWCMTKLAPDAWGLPVALLLCWAAACLSARRYAGS